MTTATDATISLEGAPATLSASPRWGYRAPAAIALAGVAIAALRGAWSDIAHYAFHDEEASHIMLVPFLMALLVWVRRRRLSPAAVGASWIGPIIVAIGWAVSHVGFHHSVQSLWHGGAVIMAIGCIASVMGSSVLTAFWPAALVALFLVPMPASVRIPLAAKLQTATAYVTERCMSVLGSGVSRYNNQLLVNGKAVLVVEACNGMRMVFPLFLVVYVFCFAMPLRGWVRAVLIAASPLAAVACNVIRLVPTMWLHGHASPAAASAFHDYSGWPMIIVAFLMLMGIIRVLRWLKVPVMVPRPAES